MPSFTKCRRAERRLDNELKGAVPAIPHFPFYALSTKYHGKHLFFPSPELCELIMDHALERGARPDEVKRIALKHVARHNDNGNTRMAQMLVYAFELELAYEGPAASAPNRAGGNLTGRVPVVRAGFQLDPE